MLPKTTLLHCQEADYLVFDTQDAITQHLRFRGTWEPHFTLMTEVFTHGIDAPLVLDIGANLGAYAVPVAKKLAATRGTVYAFEPLRTVYYQLCGNIFLNRLDNVVAQCMAIGDSDGVVQIPAIDYSATNNVGGFSLVAGIRRETQAVAERASEPAVETPIAKLDSLPFPKLPCLLKIDTEGYDLNVLMGAVKLLEAAHFPPLLFEAWNFDWFKSEKDKLFEYLQRLGYGITAIFADDYVAQHPQNPVRVDFVTDGHGRFNMTRVR